MQIKISTIVDIDEKHLNIADRYISAREYLNDTITFYLQNKHNEDAMKWLAKSKGKGSGDYLLFEDHKESATLCKNLKWQYEVVE